MSDGILLPNCAHPLARPHAHEKTNLLCPTLSLITVRMPPLHLLEPKDVCLRDTRLSQELKVLLHSLPLSPGCVDVPHYILSRVLLLPVCGHGSGNRSVRYTSALYRLERYR